MKLFKQRIKFIAKMLLLAFSVISILFLQSCECISTDENLQMLVFSGDRSRDCEKLLRDFSFGGAPDTTYICKGEPVTICWKSSAISKLTMTIGSNTQSVSASGSQLMNISTTTTITLSPVGAKCATAKTFTVKVVDSPTPTRWDAGFDLKCSKITFQISDVFISKTIKAKDIRADWYPTVNYTDAQGNTSTVVCTYPPFLTGEQQQEAFGFEITKPFVSVTFGRPLSAVGTWNFLVTATCPAANYECNHAASFPFNLTLICP